MARGFKLANIYSSELQKYCVDLAFVVTSKFMVLFCCFIFILGLFNDVHNSLQLYNVDDNE